MLSGLGYRYRLQYSKLPGHPDVAFLGRQKVIWIHGCFFHRHEGCELARLPKSRLEFWQPKLEANRARDLRHEQDLDALGWSFLVVWECELRDRGALRRRLMEFLGAVHAIS